MSSSIFPMGRAVSLLVLCGAVAGCSGGKGGGSYTFSDSDDAGLALTAATAPAAVYLGSLLAIAFHTDATCPTVVESETSVEVVGGCTDSDGTTWSGTLRVVAGSGADSVVFDGWSISAGSEKLGASGTLTVQSTEEGDITDVQTTDLVLDLRSNGEDATLSYSAYASSGDISSTSLGGSGALTVSADVELDGSSFSLAGSEDFDGSCFDEPTSGSLVATGSNVLTLSFDGATSCDGCIPWSTDDGGSDTYCGDEGADTGR